MSGTRPSDLAKRRARRIDRPLGVAKANVPAENRSLQRAAMRFSGVAPLNANTLLLPDANIGIVWSAKCACTKVVLWHLKILNLLDAALFYHAWPHQYRVQVLYRSQQYMEWMQTSDWRRFTWYQFARDPVKRLLSAFRHNIAFGYADRRISAALGREVSFRDGYSLNDFLDYLDTLQLASDPDQHVKQQRNEVSSVVDTNVINIDEVDMLEQMNAIERKHGLSITDFQSLSAFHTDDRRRVKFAGPEGFSAVRSLNQRDAEGAWPAEASLLDAATTARIKQLYARDMQFICGEADKADRGDANIIGTYRRAKVLD